MRKYFYRIFGLKFESELELPELEKENFEDPDIQIRIGKNPEHLPVIEKKGVLFETSSNDFLFRFSTIGTYRIQNGKIITIDPNPAATISEICLFLFGSTMGALFHQRGNLPLHGSSVVINNCAISIIGNSSAGKSTLAAGFAFDGYEILSDDISVLSDKGLNNFEVQPGLPHLKLWEDVLKYMKSADNLNKVRPAINKYIQPLDQAFHTTAVPLKVIICLEINNSYGFTKETIIGAEKFNLIKNHTYRNQYISGRNNVKNHFKQVAELSERILLYRVKRPEYPLMVYELVEYIKKKVLHI